MTQFDHFEMRSAPTSPVGEDGQIQFGRYLGRTSRINWSRTGLNPLWRFLHWKRWQYASVVGQDCVVAVAIVDLGWAMNAFAYVFDRRARRVLADVSLIGVRPLSGSVADDVTPGAKSTFGRGGARLSIERSGSIWNISVSCQQLKVKPTLAENFHNLITADLPGILGGGLALGWGYLAICLVRSGPAWGAGRRKAH